MYARKPSQRVSRNIAKPRTTSANPAPTKAIAAESECTVRLTSSGERPTPIEPIAASASSPSPTVRDPRWGKPVRIRIVPRTRRMPKITIEALKTTCQGEQTLRLSQTPQFTAPRSLM